MSLPISSSSALSEIFSSMGVSAEDDKNVSKGGFVLHFSCASRQLVLTINHHADRVLCDICSSHHHAGERPLIGQLGIGQQQTGVCRHAHAAFVFIVGNDRGILAPLLDEQVPWKPVAFVLGTRREWVYLMPSTHGVQYNSKQAKCCWTSSVSYGSTDAWSNMQPKHSDGAWFSDKWVSDGFQMRFWNYWPLLRLTYFHLVIRMSSALMVPVLQGMTSVPP